MEIVFCGTGWLPIVDEIRARLPAGMTIRVRDRSRPLVEEVAAADVILPSNAPIDAAAIAAPARLLLIQQPAVGYERIDLDAARARGVPVCNAPGVNGEAVAEAAFLLMLALVRRLPLARRAFAAGTIGEPLGTELHGKTLGLIGAGRSGTRVAAIGAALGMKVLSVRSSSSPPELEQLLAESDVISIHAPLNERTRGMFDAAAFARMKRGAMLINCSRGPIVDRASVEGALADGRLGGLGLDVFWAEPWDPADPLFARDDVVTLPHVGGSTREAFGRIADTVVDNVKRVARGEPVQFRVA